VPEVPFMVWDGSTMYMDPRESPHQTASSSIQPFLHNRPTLLYCNRLYLN